MSQVNATVAVDAALMHMIVKVQVLPAVGMLSRSAAATDGCLQAEGQPQRRLSSQRGFLSTLQDQQGCSFSQLLSLPGSSLEGCS